MAVEKPVIVFVHGGWHLPLHYINLIQALLDEGYVVEAPTNASAGNGPAVGEKSMEDDEAVIRASMAPHLDAGKNIVLVCHSYGGIPGQHSIKGNRAGEREAAGLRGGIKAVVWIASFPLPQRGMSLWTLVQPPTAWWGGEDEFVALYEGAADVLYNDIDEPIKTMAANSLVKQSVLSYKSETTFAAAEIGIPQIYVVCEKDLAIPVQHQLQFAEACGGEVVRIDYGHSPFLKKDGAAALVDIINKAAAAV